jgi:archaellum component FlaF (FlaF/FlaG flagellin family)
MENGLPALLIAAILMLSTVLMARGGFLGADAIGQSLQQSEVRHGQQNRTALTVTSTSIDGSGANITVTVRNDGQTPITNFAGMDVVVQYFGETATRYDKWIPYTSGALASNTWKTGTFTNDVFEPGILNSGESVDLLIRVNPVVGQATTNLAIIGTEKGVTVQTYFAGPP